MTIAVTYCFRDTRVVRRSNYSARETRCHRVGETERGQLPETGLLHLLDPSVLKIGRDHLRPQQYKTNEMACAASKASDQPGRLPSLIRVGCPHEESLDP